MFRLAAVGPGTPNWRATTPPRRPTVSHVNDLTQLEDQADAADLLARFANFDDAVVQEVHLVLSGATGQRWAELKVLAREGSTGDGDWQTVTLRVEGLSRFRIAEGPASYLVLSDGLDLIRRPSQWQVRLGSPDDADAPTFEGSICGYRCVPADS